MNIIHPAQPRWADPTLSDQLTWRSRVTEIRSLSEDFFPVGVSLRLARVAGANPFVVVSSVFGDVPLSPGQALAVSHTLARLAKELGE